MSNMHNNAISVMSTHKLRAAQDIAVYNMELGDQFDGFDGSAHQQVWLEDPIWQGVRENVERMWVIGDWAEEVFAANIVFEPLVGELFRSQFVMRTAPQYGDFLTPTIMGCIESDYDRDLNATRDMFSLLVEDEAHGDENKQVMQEWLAHWVPYSIKAAQGLKPIWSESKVDVGSFEDALERVKARFESILSDLGLQLTGELQEEVTA
jgi:propane monooxygenase small subunit